MGFMEERSGRIARLQAGDEAEWEALVREFSPQLFRYFLCHLGPRERATAEDLVQETFTGALQAIGRFKLEYSPAQFLFGIARNRLVDLIRKRRHREILLPPTPPDESQSSGIGAHLGRFASDRRSPAESALAWEENLRRRKALAGCLRSLVGSLWEKGEFEQLKVLEFLLALGGRNKEAARIFQVGSERAVAGIKFRALGKIRECLREKDPSRTLFPGLWAPGAM